MYRDIDRYQLYEFKEVFTGSIILAITHGLPFRGWMLGHYKSDNTR